jgi:hypothetical protein
MPSADRGRYPGNRDAEAAKVWRMAGGWKGCLKRQDGVGFRGGISTGDEAGEVDVKRRR